MGTDQEGVEPITIFVNSGFGHGSHVCRLNPDDTLVLPDALIEELRANPDDTFDFELDEEEGVLYIRVRQQEWEPPNWLDPME